MVVAAPKTSYIEKGEITHYELKNGDLQSILHQCQNNIIILKFYSNSCPPCRYISDALESYFYRPVHLISINCSDIQNSNIVNQYKINKIPAFVLVDKNGNTLKKELIVEKEQFVQLVDFAYENVAHQSRSL